MKCAPERGATGGLAMLGTQAVRLAQLATALHMDQAARLRAAMSVRPPAPSPVEPASVTEASP